MADAYVLDAVRAPFGRYGGALAGVRPDDLGAHVVRALLDRAPGLDPQRIDDVMFGNANGAGEDNRDVARMAVLLAGLPTSVPGTTINRLCGSSLDASIQASRAVETGDADLVLVGGVESMSRAPWVLLKPDQGFPSGGAELHSTTLGWRMVNPQMPEQWTISLGESTEKLAGIYSISREAQDEFAVRSHRNAHRAWEDGFYADWVAPVPGTDLERDEGIRPDTSPEKLAKLKPAFRADGTVTAGNASPLNDGAAAVWIGSGAPRRPGCGRWRGSPGAGRSPSTPTCSASAPWRRRGARWTGPASAGATSTSSSSTRRSRRSRSRAWRNGPSSTRTRSTCTAAPSRSATRSGRPARGSSARSSTACAGAAGAGGWRRSASAWARASPWCWRRAKR